MTSSEAQGAYVQSPGFIQFNAIAAIFGVGIMLFSGNIALAYMLVALCINVICFLAIPGTTAFKEQAQVRAIESKTAKVRKRIAEEIQKLGFGETNDINKKYHSLQAWRDAIVLQKPSNAELIRLCEIENQFLNLCLHRLLLARSDSIKNSEKISKINDQIDYVLSSLEDYHQGMASNTTEAVNTLNERISDMKYESKVEQELSQTVSNKRR